jgi:predicted AlkP superfamily pyrophosphatase or phosphodiesterase
MARLTLRVAGLAGVGVLAATVGTGATPSSAAGHDSAKHVLLISVDGLHQTDLAWYVATHPTSALASLVSRGVEFTHAQTPVVSDSFPGHGKPGDGR